MMDDHELLDQLGGALSPGEASPPEHRVAALRRKVEAAHWRARHAGQDDRPGRLLGVLSGRAAAVAACVALFITGVGVGHGLPRSLRQVAYTVGLPVDSPALLDVKADVSRLSRALEGDRADEVSAADASLQARLRGLDADERAEMEPLAHQLHLRAMEFRGGREGVPSGTPTPDPPAGGDLSPVPTTPPTSVPSDDELRDDPDEVATTVVPDSDLPEVTITAITLEPTARYRVDFEATGFTPDGSGDPGTFVIRFFFDDGSEGYITHSDSSPWSFNAAAAARYSRLCARVADHEAEPLPHSGNCVPIPGPATPGTTVPPTSPTTSAEAAVSP